MQKGRVYSYLRFSDPRQRDGASIERQTAQAAKWAEDHGLLLDTSLNLRDEGLSAYDRTNVTKGALGTFLNAVESGLVPKGSVLVVESLDRLSRAEVDIALKQLLDIIQAGITIVTVGDNGREYSAEGFRRNPVDIIVGITVMMRAHEESKTKSDRVTDALKRKCQEWNDGTWRGRLSSGKDPKWVRYNREQNAFEYEPRVAESLRTLLHLYIEGYSPTRAFALMRQRGIEIPPGVATTTRLYVVMRCRSLVGEKSVNVGGETFTLPGYYPPLISEAEFASLEFVRSQRGKRTGKASIVTVISGLGITYCARCRSAMGGQNIMGRRKLYNGLPSEGHRRLFCTGNRKAHGQCDIGSCSIVPIERAMMAYCSNQMNLAALFVESDEKSHSLNEALSLARQAAADTQRKLAKFMAAAASDDGETPESLLAQVRSFEKQLAAEKVKVTEYEYELEALHRHSQPAAAEIWAGLREGVELLDNAARTKARQLVADSFRRIEVSLVHPLMIGLKLVSKREIERTLWIDRVTGDLLDQIEIEDRARHTPLKTLHNLGRVA